MSRGTAPNLGAAPSRRAPLGRRARAALLGLLATLSIAPGCDYGIRLSGSPPDLAPRTLQRAAPTAKVAASAPVDPLATAPELGAPRPFEPKAPEVFQGPGGITVWLVPRAALPLVSATVVVPYGAASDPEDRPGTMTLLADLLDEGAGKRTALELSEAVAALGGSLSTTAGTDGSYAQLTVLKGKLDEGFGLLADVVARPRFDPKDLARVKKLWKNALKNRADDPAVVGALVASAVAYGPTTPYGHPASGVLSKADAIDLAALRKAYERTWRPDRATLVVVGQVSRAEVEALLAKHLGDFRSKGEPLPAPTLTKVRAERPRVVLVDRPKAVQTVIVAVRDGVAAGDEAAPALSLVNTALGGSFTSRLNSNLREEKGWTYGVRSAMSAMRGPGTFTVRTSVEAKHTGAAAKEILGELSKMADAGLSPDELEKTKAQDRADLVETYETVSQTASRLGSLVALGLPPTFDASASRLRQAASREELARLAKAHVEPTGITLVLVGDRASIEAQLVDAGLVGGAAGPPDLWTPEIAPAPKR